jgi:hypothetical protein
MNGLPCQSAGTHVFRKAKSIAPLIRWPLLLLLLASAGTSCAPNANPVPESQYRTKLLGDWQGTVGDMKETISFGADGGFTSQVRQMGFISNTLGQGVTGTIRGTWVLQGKVLTMNITSAEDARVLNKVATSTIESFKPNELVLKSAGGGTSTFLRAL